MTQPRPCGHSVPLPFGRHADAARRAILGHLQDRGAASQTELDRVLRARIADHRDDPACSGLRQLLSLLARGGHIHRIGARGKRRWKSGTGPLTERTAAARQIPMLGTSVYRPPVPSAVRQGAMDFTRIPSVLLGRRCPYRAPSPLSAPGG
jgi:hypothetical protein